MKKSITVLSLFLFTSIFSTNADAISRRGASILRNVKGTIRISGLKVISAYEKGPVTRRVVSHYDNLRRNLYRAVRAYNRIPRNDFSDPEVTRIGNLLRRLDAHLKILKKRVKAAADEEAKYKNMHFAFAKKYGRDQKYVKAIMILFNIEDRPDLDFLSTMLNDTGIKKDKKAAKRSWRTKRTTQTTVTETPFKKFVKNLETIAAACEGEFKGIRNIITYSHGKRSSYADWCKIIKKRDHRDIK